MRKVVYLSVIFLIAACGLIQNQHKTSVIENQANYKLAYKPDICKVIKKISFAKEELEFLNQRSTVVFFLDIDLCNEKVNDVYFRSNYTHFDKVNKYLFNSEEERVEKLRISSHIDSVSMVNYNLTKDMENKIRNAILNKVKVKVEKLYEDKPILCDTSIVYGYDCFINPR